MTAAELLKQLSQQGVTFSVENEKLSIRSPKGVVTPTLRAELMTYKPAILDILSAERRQAVASVSPERGLSLATIGRLIGGSGTQTGQPRSPAINPLAMAQSLTVTFRPLPKGYKMPAVLQFRSELEEKLRSYGVTILPWQAATKPFRYDIGLPWGLGKFSFKTQVVKASVSAVIDVERPTSLRQRAETSFAEGLYRFCRRFLWGAQPSSIARIAKVTAWAETHAAKYVENPNDTQIVVLTELDPVFTHPQLPYPQKIGIGINKLVQTFSEIVVGVSSDRISILNMNLSDSLFSREEMARFTLKSLIPKIFVPIAPLCLNQFTLSEYNPHRSPYAQKLVSLGQRIAPTGLLPPGFKLKEAIARQSHRDIVDTIVNGRTGVSYGFLAYIEPPRYVGDLEIDAAVWQTLAEVPGFDPAELRENTQGRRYVRLQRQDGQRQDAEYQDGPYQDDWIYRQLPDIWLVSSRSGANKTNLSLGQDVLRVGLRNGLQLALPEGVDASHSDIKPSYDIYVMVAIALAAALYLPQLVEQGAPIFHFHGYPSADWFQSGEYCSGLQNPSVPCGTYESGIFNFLGIRRLAEQINHNTCRKPALLSLIEPDHGTNLIAPDLDYLIKRLHEGSELGQIELGGRHFPSLYKHFAQSENRPEEKTRALK